MKALRLGTRGSALALAQAGEVERLLLAEDFDLRVEQVVFKTEGDRRLDLSLQSTGSLSKGLFTKELEEALHSGKIDCAVHSLKDLPTDKKPGLMLSAILPREDTSDVLISKVPLEALRPGAVIGTSSPRRAMQLAEHSPHLAFVEIRGNVPTRIRKLLERGELDGIVLALAGLKRLGLVDGVARWMPSAGEFSNLHLEVLDFLLPAPGQGAIAVETREPVGEQFSALSRVHCSTSAFCVNAERSLLQLLGGGCHLSLGAHGLFVEPEIFELRAVYRDDSGTLFRGVSRSKNPGDYLEPARRIMKDWNL